LVIREREKAHAIWFQQIRHRYHWAGDKQRARRSSRAIGKVAFNGHDLQGKAVLVYTGWDLHWRTDQYFEGHPFPTQDAAEYLAQAGVALRGFLSSFHGTPPKRHESL
jgi:kynurenine formamidase